MKRFKFILPVIVISLFCCTSLWFASNGVIADSPLLSTLVAQNAPDEIKGTALSIVNCIGFSITIISIQLINGMQALTNSNIIYIILALGPFLGLIAIRQKKQHTTKPIDRPVSHPYRR